MSQEHNIHTTNNVHKGVVILARKANSQLRGHVLVQHITFALS